MTSKRWTLTAAAWITGLAVLVAGVTNAHAHVHLCFDGQEAPAAIHLDDDTGHLLEHAAGSQHDDVDVDLQGQALAKSVKHDLTAIDAPVVWTLSFDRQAVTPQHASADTPRRPPAPYLTPPLRAPPR